MKTLKPSLPMLRTVMPVLAEKAGSTRRERGRRWMGKRAEVLRRDGYACVSCGRVSLANEIDHDVPLEQGGSNDPANLRTLCPDCHGAKTASEQRQRHAVGAVQKSVAPAPRKPLGSSRADYLSRVD